MANNCKTDQYVFNTMNTTPLITNEVTGNGKGVFGVCVCTCVCEWGGGRGNGDWGNGASSL